MTAEGKWFSGEFTDLRERLEGHYARMRDWCQGLSEKSETGLHLILGGGYGRGEGGVSIEANGSAKLHNDLDYFLFLDDPGSLANLGDAIREIEASESAHLDVDVEIQALPLSNIREQAHTLMMTDLANGHDTVYGDITAAIKIIPLQDYTHVPLDEVTRLLWNRGSGIYFAKQQIVQTDNGPIDDATMRFVVRNLQKVYLALGDAHLLQNRVYDVKVAKRAELLAQRFNDPTPRYAEAAAFKERPTFPETILERAEMLEAIDSARDAWITGFLTHESQRLGTDFPNPQAYVDFKGQIYPQSSKIKNILLRIRDHLKYKTHLPGLMDYPRAALHRALCAMLFPESGYLQKLGWSADVHDNSFKDSYTAWWSRYS